MRLIEENQFDTIYHEHFSYFSLLTVERIFAAHGLALFDVEELPTHGGSLRIYARHADDAARRSSDARRARSRRARSAAGLDATSTTYVAFGRARAAGRSASSSSSSSTPKTRARRVVGYGAPAKGNTLLNYCGDRHRPHRLHGRPQPAQAGPVPAGHAHPDPRARGDRATRPDFVLILPWNLREEIMEQLRFVSDWGGRFLVRAPALELYA